MLRIKDYLDHLIAASSPDRPAWNLEAIREKREVSWNYVDGCMIMAILRIYARTREKKYLTFADEFIDYYIKEDGSILGYRLEDYNCDQINGGKVLFPLYDLTGKEKYKAALERLYQQLLTHPRTSAGSFWHKRIYPQQVWLDGLYMVLPFYMEYEKRFHENRNYKDIVRQLELAHQQMLDQKTKLLYHGYDESKRSFWADQASGCSRNFWTRSLGWYTMALVDTIAVMDEQLFYEFQMLQDFLKEILTALLAVQDQETKLFYQVTDQGARAGNYLETSGSCAIAYSFMKGARLNFLPKYYFSYGKEIFEAVVRYKLMPVEAGFVLKDICLAAGLGGMPGKGSYPLRDGSFEYYISEPAVADDAKGVAPFLFAFAELCE